MAMKTFGIEVDSDGIGIVTLDVPDRSMNTITPDVIDEFPEVVDRIASDPAIRGAVFASGKPSGFCAGAELANQAQSAGATQTRSELEASFERAFRLNKLLRSLETGGKPVAIALEGLALGGGLEIALACHYRVAASHPRMRLGLPESTIGLLPGGGGTQRLPRLIGAAKALPILLDGKPLSAEAALAAGFIDQVVAPGEALAAAKAWVRTGSPVQPWDRKDFVVPGGGPYSSTGSAAFVHGTAAMRKKSFGNYPALKNIMQCVYEGLQLPIDAALRIETRYFLKTRQTPQAKAMIRTHFQSKQALGKGALRPGGVARFEVAKAAVLGAGMMGAGIAYSQAAVGIETVLIDVSQEAAEKGKAHAATVVDKAIARGTMDRVAGNALLALIHPTTDYTAARGSDIVIEAVFEDRELKGAVTRQAEMHLAAGGIFGSNTSTLPISGLAAASANPEVFIGVHFFSPVDRMELVEIIVGDRTSRETLAKALDYVQRLRKTPIVVNDSRGFFTSRCFGTYTAEGVELLADGFAPAIIDNLGRATGMPRGPLELYDDVALDLILKVREQARRDLGSSFEPRAADWVLDRMVNDHGRLGRKNGQGFYDYPANGGPKRPWDGLGEIVAVTRARADAAVQEEVRNRLLYRQAIEAARCLDEGVITDPRAADVGATLGWGFAPWTGGPLSLIDMVGVAVFVERCELLAKQCGPRFEPPALLHRLAASGGAIYDVPVKAAA
jgi:3-hydroxyacyl-CoA dehydrogenase/enoyl-CoA hydratase/3-hydroxybutyryl-CoA epimerase